MKVTLLFIIFGFYAFAQDVWLDEAKIRLNWQDAQEYCKKQNAILPSKKQFVKEVL